jgi:glutathione reductase (NADPH)
MKDFDCDLFVIGGGSGGVRAARMAAQRGARVMLAEAAALGGTCVNVGCIPKKLYSYAAHFASDFTDAAGFGWEVAAPRFDWAVLKANRAKEIARLNGVYDQLLRTAGVDVLRGWARLADPHTVRLRLPDGERDVTARHILVATGSTATVPLFEGRELALTSDHMFDLDPFPRRLAVVGGGYIACEFASIFQGLGAQVTQLYRGEQVLRGFDDDVRHFVAAEMGKHGVALRLGTEVRAIARAAGGLAVALTDGTVLEADAVLYATGRAPNVNGLGLEALGVRQAGNGAVEVDRHYRSSVPSVHALGDVVGRMQLTPVALAEAMVLVDHLFGDGERTLDYDLIPTAVFTHPNIGTVGLSEAAARAKHGEVQVFRTDFRALKDTLGGGTERTLMKLVVESRGGRVVGLHMVGPDAGEIVQGFAVAMKAGATKAVFDATVGIHPTAAEEFVTLREPVAGPPARYTTA